MGFQAPKIKKQNQNTNSKMNWIAIGIWDFKYWNFLLRYLHRE